MSNKLFKMFNFLKFYRKTMQHFILVNDKLVVWFITVLINIQYTIRITKDVVKKTKPEMKNFCDIQI